MVFKSIIHVEYCFDGIKEKFEKVKKPLCIFNTTDEVIPQRLVMKLF